MSSRARGAFSELYRLRRPSEKVMAFMDGLKIEAIRKTAFGSSRVATLLAWSPRAALGAVAMSPIPMNRPVPRNRCQAASGAGMARMWRSTWSRVHDLEGDPFGLPPIWPASICWMSEVAPTLSAFRIGPSTAPGRTLVGWAVGGGHESRERVC